MRNVLVSLVVLFTALAVPACGQDTVFDNSRFPYRAFDALPATEIKVPGGVVVLAYAPGGNFAMSKTEIAAWVERCARTVAAYYGRFPVDKYRLLIVPVPGIGMHGGTTWGYHGGATKLRLGQGVMASELENDWVLIHEMIHTAFPEVGDSHHWIEEGLATYVESIARMQSGGEDPATAWRGILKGMPHGEPEDGDQGLDNTHTWGRTYWGGALFCLVADVRIRERTGNKYGLQDALRGIIKDGGSIEEQDWSIDHAFEVGDRAIGVKVLEELYAETADKPVEFDLDALWKKLGIVMEDGRVTFDDKAPEADIRRAMTTLHP